MPDSNILVFPTPKRESKSKRKAPAPEPVYADPTEVVGSVFNPAVDFEQSGIYAIVDAAKRDPITWGRAYRKAAQQVYRGHPFSHFAPDALVDEIHEETGGKGAWVEILVWIPLEKAKEHL